jgi:homoserine dehydrogenase
LKEPVIVLKFGSSVLRSSADLPTVVHEIYRWYRDGFRVIAVVSAIGSATESLLRQARELSASPEPWATAELLATGERTSAALIGIALDRAGIRARVVNPREIGLRVAGAPLDGEPVEVSVPHTRELLDQNPVLVVPGFFGTDAAGRTQLLGRGGSDLSAIFLSCALGARCRLVKDVDGVYEADPAAANAHPRRFAQLHYIDALRVAGKLIQPKAVAYLQSHHASCEVSALTLPYQTIVHGGETTLASVSVASGLVDAPLDVVLLGCGTVGFGVYQRLRALHGFFRIAGVLVRDIPKHEAAGIPTELLHTRVESLDSLRPALLVDALPGIEPSYTLTKTSLRRGVHVVSANKAVIAEHGGELRRISQEGDARLAYSAAVGGSAPLLEAADRLMADGSDNSMTAVINGTCNFVLDACALGAPLADAIAEAQRLGFAELDPSDDLSGRDAARKLGILIRHAFGVEPPAISVQPLDERIAAAAFDAARSGDRLRQVARAGIQRGSIEAAVAFERLPAGSALASLRNEWNGLVPANAPEKLLSGRGAGRWPTTEAMVADCLDVVRLIRTAAKRVHRRQDAL